MAKTRQKEPRADLAPSHEHAQDELLECVEECLNCHAVCTITLQHCMAKGGALTELNLVGLLLDCAEICQTSANFMLRGSPYHIITCGACAELCRACAAACDAIPDDEQMAHCAEVCGECAESCGRMSQLDDEEID
jgi:hypothetical protein